MSLTDRIRNPAASLRSNERGVAFVEFAYALPIFVALTMSGLEITNYVTTHMRVSQVALHIADHAARLGEGEQLAAKTVTEQHINDILIGASLQAGELDLLTNGRVILSSLEPVASPNAAPPNDRYRIRWQRCAGSQTHASTYGVAGQASGLNMTGMGPAGRQVKAPDNSATMFVEVFYRYQPIIAGQFAPSLEFTEIASMTVRERRDLAGGTDGIHPVAGVTPSTCA
jgi:Flp pilus assembly protein TadG